MLRLEHGAKEWWRTMRREGVAGGGGADPNYSAICKIQTSSYKSFVIQNMLSLRNIWSVHANFWIAITKLYYKT
jgi:hypothetical protein